MAIHGQQRLERKTKELDKDYSRKLEPAVKSGALIVERDAKGKASYKSGTLKRSIHIEPIEKTKTRVVVSVGTNLEYARIQEFGGVVKAKKGPFLRFKTADGEWHSVRAVIIPAHPYLRPAFDENKRKVVREIGDALKVMK